METLQLLKSPSRHEMCSNRTTSRAPVSNPTDSLPKRKRRALRDGEKFMICTLYKQIYRKMLEEEKKDMPDGFNVKVNKNECVLKTAALLGVSRSTLFRVLKEEKEYESFNPPLKPGPKAGFREKYDESVFLAIRAIVDDLSQSQPPTMAKILQAVHDDKDLPNFSMTTMRKILHSLNLKQTNKRKSRKLSDNQGDNHQIHPNDSHK